MERQAMLTRTQQEAVAFWRDVQATFPHTSVQAWLDTLEAGRGDWFRNFSLARVAVAAHSVSPRGRWSPIAQEENDARLRALVEKHPIARQFQE